MSSKLATSSFPISEIFTSVQGEGVYCGTMMTFIRLAGCTVGKPFNKERYEVEFKPRSEGLTTMVDKARLNMGRLPIYTEQCTLYDGRKFACDTDYRVKTRMTTEVIMAHIPKNIRHICISGGEPFMHNLDELYMSIPDSTMLHIETSGTIPIKTAFVDNWDITGDRNFLWITVSPKYGILPEMIERANEIKLLVDEHFDPDKLPKGVLDHEAVFIQPINFEHTVNPANVKLCMEWQKKFPQFRVSLQLHKVLEYFINERVS